MSKTTQQNLSCLVKGSKRVSLRREKEGSNGELRRHEQTGLGFDGQFNKVGLSTWKNMPANSVVSLALPRLDVTAVQADSPLPFAEFDSCAFDIPDRWP